MGFELQRIAADDSIEETDIHKQAVLKHYGLPLRKRVADGSRRIYLYVISVSSSETRPPGTYLLFVDGCPVYVKAYDQGSAPSGDRRVNTFLVHSIEIPDALKGKRDFVLEVLKEALLRWKQESFPGTERVELKMWGV